MIENRLVVIQIPPAVVRDHVELFAKMMAGFAVIAATPNETQGWELVDYLCWHPDLPEIDLGATPPVGRFIMTALPGRQAWHIEVEGRRYAHGFVFTEGADEVQGQ